jgi:putative oxidoreductase
MLGATSRGGYEYPLLWAIVMLGATIRGGGPLSVDRALGREF